MKSPRRSKPLQLLWHNNVWMQLADLDDRERVAPLLSYEQVWWEDVLFKCKDCGHLVSKKEASYYIRWRKKGGSNSSDVPCLDCGSMERQFFGGTKKLKKRRSRQLLMVTEKRGRLYTGFLPYLQERFDVELSGNKQGWIAFAQRSKIDLRPYQRKALLAITSKLRGQISLPTGTGKTILAAAVLDYFCLREKKALFVVHTKDLLWQTKAEFEKFLGTEIGYIGDSGCELKRVTVGMIQSLKNYDFVSKASRAT